MTPTKSFFISVEERDRLYARDFEALATAHVLAGQQVFATDHVRARLGELRAVPLVSAARQLPLLGTDDPADVVLILLPAVGAGQRGFPGFLSLVVEVALFHREPPENIIIPQEVGANDFSRRFTGSSRSIFPT